MRRIFFSKHIFLYLRLPHSDEKILFGVNLLTKIALAQIEICPGRPDLNTSRMLDFITKARAAAADMVIFPEMSIPGYLLGDTWEQPAFLRDCEDWGRTVVAASDNICILFGNVAVDWKKTGDDGRVRKYNAFFAAQNGKLAGGENYAYPFRIKTLQPNYREFDDDRHFFSLRKLALEQGNSIESLLQPLTVTIAGQPLRLGCILCEDGWSDDYSIKPVNELHRNGPVDIFINISSSPFTLGKNNKRHRVFSGQAGAAGVPLLYVNNVGIQNNGKTVYTFDGCSTAYDRCGKTVLHCPPFKEHLAFISLEDMQGANAATEADFPDDRNIDSVYACLRYGVNSFLRQTGLKRIAVGVSGGIDSAVAAALYVDVLGPDQVLLVNMPSHFNSQTTISLAQTLSTSLGCRYASIPINESVDLTLRQMDAANLTLSSFMRENVQARDRSSRILAAAAAGFGGAFTCNANKSELTVGYCTLYGDEAGCLAALADLWKFQVYELGRYLNEHVFQKQVIPAEIFTIVPSAELSHDQDVDAGKGDPLVYPYHDFLFRAFVERWQRATPEEILSWYAEGSLEQNIGCAPGLAGKIFAAPSDFIQDLERWWQLYTGMGVAKRIQAPPVLAVSRRAFGFDHREAQNPVHYTRRYLEMKEELLHTKSSGGSQHV